MLLVMICLTQELRGRLRGILIVVWPRAHTRLRSLVKVPDELDEKAVHAWLLVPSRELHDQPKQTQLLYFISTYTTRRGFENSMCSSGNKRRARIASALRSRATGNV